MQRVRTRLALGGLIAVLSVFAGRIAKADERLLAFSYGAEVLPKGKLEFEQWITDSNGHAGEFYNGYAIDQELEYGITDRLSGSLYLHFKQNYSSSKDPLTGLITSTDELRFDGVSTEWKYLVLSPITDPFGLLLYFEPRFSGPELELEGKLILERDLGDKWVGIANLVVEQEYGYGADSTEIKGEPKVSLGIAYKISPAFSLGLEAKEDMIWPDNWGYESESGFYAGPTVHYGGEKWWGTLGVAAQLHGAPETLKGDGRNIAAGDEDFSKVQVKLGLGIDF